MTLTKVTETTLLAIVSTASNSVTIGSAVDVSTWYAANIKIRMGRGTGTAFTRAPSVRIEGTYLTSPTANDWSVLREFQMGVGVATIGNTTVNGTEAVGQTVVTLTSGTNFTAGDYIFFHNGTIANSEWARIVSVATNDITIEEGLTIEQANTTPVRDQSEQYVVDLDLTSIQKLRIVVDGQGSGQAVICEAVAGAVTGL